MVRNGGTSAAVGLPEAKPRVIGIHDVVALVRGFAVGGLKRATVGQGVNMLECLNLRNGLLNIHVEVEKKLDAARAAHEQQETE